MRQANLIDGKWVEADSGRTLEVLDPATDARVGSVPVMGAAETRRAVDAAAEAWQDARTAEAAEEARGRASWRWFAGRQLLKRRRVP